MALSLLHSTTDLPQQRTTVVITDAHVNAALLMVGRLLFGGYFIYAGLHHFIDRAALATYAAAHGVPQPEMAIPFTGLMIILGGLSVVTGIVPRVGAALIALFLIGVTPIMHAFWKDPTPAMAAADLANFGKNIALLGGACVAAALPVPWPASPFRREIEEIAA